MGWISLTQSILECLYYIAGIAMFATVLIGVNQLRLLKKDIELKHERLSIEKSIEYLNWFAGFIPEYSRFNRAFVEIKEKYINDFVPEKERPLIRQELEQYNNKKIESNDPFLFQGESKPFQTVATLMYMSKAEHILNQLEYFAAAMMSGLAKEDLAYKPLSQIYCKIVEDLYCIICNSREENPDLYSNVVGLYRTWKSKREKEELQSAQQEISEKLSRIPDTKIKSIGL